MTTQNSRQGQQERGGRERLVVIGNGMAGMRAVEELLAIDPGRYAITVFGAEPRGNYNRIMLSPLLAAEKRFEEILLNDLDWYAANGITLKAGDPVVAIDRERRVVTARSGLECGYDRLLLATGSDPIVIPVPGRDLPGLVTFRDVDDVAAMVAASARGGSAVVIGGGLLGLEAANGLAARGMETTVVHLAGHLMERQLDASAAHLLEGELARRGITVLTGADTAEILGPDRVTGVRLKDGREIPADLVVMAVGIRPNAALAREAALEVGRGVLVDDDMTTSDPEILAVGECVEHRGQCYGLVAPLFEMAKVVASRLAGRDGLGFTGSVPATKLKVSGVDLFSAGDFSGGPGSEDIVLRDAGRGVYKRLVLAEGRLRGLVLYGDTTDSAWYLQLLRAGEALGELRDSLAFGRAYAGGAVTQDPRQAVAALPDEAEICGCNGVCKGRIVETIARAGLTSAEQVRAHTKASASCGSCSGLVEQLLAVTLGEDYRVAEGAEPICGCTPHDHDSVRRLILARELKTIPAVMQALEWSTPDGCHSCRPALNYYLLCAWPGEYLDQAAARFVNERLHANIQKDGTYSVVPRMWGGQTSAAELRAIADVVERYAIPTVKVTGGQRIDLLGVRKQDLPSVWRDLNAAGMVSGHAYGKALRTVKTCVGSEWCRFGTRDSTAMGIALERMTWGSWMPHKVKLAVSGCPRNCAEATIKDFGVVAVESGWELHVGGNGGMKVRACDRLCKVETAEEVKLWCGAFLQLYREEARYLERTAPWIERVGLEHVAERLSDPDRRAAYHRRFLESQRHAQVDPWAERAAGAEAEAFRPLASVEG
ncbi:nitrite reductase (NADH) large subunit [Tistlia consotensis]|uniref:Assimilatory nitrite reductase (NAD(P)H) large subunit n=1 Tax=Tistlia consotensis USBA 355 TaxID=560819 RepID=A0A1Y6BZN6_9PROT|nr:nitrite reductase large subunit NirB [Tistlia consotensis]SMF36340.1 assimilatory nitrite reductase (NAD(P)H) large subunit precursor [Tistlia consotensis USBA 355]SNR71719.1 nitrite reductase (NADH) large subunit [Tistlia consotensis]